MYTLAVIILIPCGLYCVYKLAKSINRDLEPIVRRHVRRKMFEYLEADERRYYEYMNKYGRRSAR